MKFQPAFRNTLLGLLGSFGEWCRDNNKERLLDLTIELMKAIQDEVEC